MSRLIWLDFLKGWLIILVVLGHAIQYCMPNNECETNYFWCLIYSFHMPAFMAASGFINFRPNYSGGVNLCKRRTYQLLIPFFTWSITKWCIGTNHSLTSLVRITFSDGGFFWFLWALWVITMLSIGCNYIAQRFRIRQIFIYSFMALLLIGTMILFDIRVLGFQYIAFYFLFYSLGYFIHKYSTHIRFSYGILIFLFFIWLVLASYWNMHELPYFLKSIHYIPHSILQYGYRVLTATVAVVVLLVGMPEIVRKENRWITTIKDVGTYSLAIYGLQGIMVIEICRLISNITTIPMSLKITVSFVLTLILSLLLRKVLSGYSLPSHLLFGKI